MRLSWRQFAGVVFGVVLIGAGLWMYNKHVELPSKREIPVNQTIVLTDPTAIGFARSCDVVELHASGTLAPGSYQFDKYTIQAIPGTTFSFIANVPLHGKKEIKAAECSGSFSSNFPILVHGMPLPKNITVHDGKASAEVDLVSMFGTLVVNTLLHGGQHSAAQQNDIAQIVDKIKIDRAVFKLESGRVLSMKGLVLHFGADSTLTLRDVSFDANLNYQGKAEASINLLEKTAYDDEKFHLTMKSGKLRTVFGIAYTPTGMQCDAIATGEHYVWMSGAKLIIHKHTATVTITADECKLISQRFSVFDPAQGSSSIDIGGHTEFRNGFVVVEKPTATVKLDLPTKSPLQIAFKRQNKESLLAIKAPDRFVTDKGEYTLVKHGGTFNLYLLHPMLRSFALLAPGGFSVTFVQGPIHPKEISWHSAEKTINFGNFEHAQFYLRNDVTIDYSSKTKTIDADIPLRLQDASADLIGRRAKIALSDLNGDLTVSVGKSTFGIEGQLNSSIDKAVMQSKSIEDCDLHLGNIAIKATPDTVSVGIKDGEITVPRGVLEKALVERLPKKKVFTIHKEFLQEKQWRYKNMWLETITMQNPHIDTLEFAGTDKLAFTLDSDLVADGTVDKHHLFGGKWETKPWSATGHMKATGTLKFTFIPGKSLSTSAFHYDATMKLSPPQDVEIDWSKVADGLLGSAEHAVIAHKLAKNNYFLTEKTSQMTPSGDIKLFKTARAGLNDIKVSNFLAKPERSYVVIKFQSNAEL